MGRRPSRFYDTSDPDGPTVLASYNGRGGMLQPGDHVVYDNPQLGPAGMTGEYVIEELIDIGGEEPIVTAVLDDGRYEVTADNLRKVP
jgi:signal peptidase I